MSLNNPDLPLVLNSTAAYDKGDVKDITLRGLSSILLFNMRISTIACVIPAMNLTVFAVIFGSKFQ
jgi:hypothetical protein